MAYDLTSEFMIPEFIRPGRIRLADSARVIKVRGMMDSEYAEAAIGGIGIESTQPTYTAPSRELADVAEGDTLTVENLDGDGTETFTVVDKRPDGFGMTVLSLHEELEA